MAKREIYGENPFKPGAGRMPPHLAGRDGVLAEWRKNLNSSGWFFEPEIVMCGPRGTGKTAIIREFYRLAQESDCNVVRDTVAILNYDQDTMADKLLSRFESASYTDTETTSEEFRGGIGVPGLGEGGMTAGRSQTTKHRDPTSVRTIAERLHAVASRKPLIVLLDEAHAVMDEAELKSLRALVNAVQQLVSDDEPICLVLAGTPGLSQMLADAKCSFEDRFHTIGVGLLDEESAAEAIATPLADHVWRTDDPESRLRIEPAALDAVVKASQGYPYFLQLWGRGLWDSAASRGADALTVADVETARPAVDASRSVHYQKRGREIDFNDDFLAAANAVAEAFNQYYAKGDARLIGRMAIINAVRQALTPDYPDRHKLSAAAKRCMEEMARLGFAWSPPGSMQMEPGIPSFLNYAQELYANRRG